MIPATYDLSLVSSPSGCAIGAAAHEKPTALVCTAPVAPKPRQATQASYPYVSAEVCVFLGFTQLSPQRGAAQLCPSLHPGCQRGLPEWLGRDLQSGTWVSSSHHIKLLELTAVYHFAPQLSRKHVMVRLDNDCDGLPQQQTVRFQSL